MNELFSLVWIQWFVFDFRWKENVILFGKLWYILNDNIQYSFTWEKSLYKIIVFLYRYISCWWFFSLIFSIISAVRITVEMNMAFVRMNKFQNIYTARHQKCHCQKQILVLCIEKCHVQKRCRWNNSKYLSVNISVQYLFLTLEFINSCCWCLWQFRMFTKERASFKTHTHNTVL